MLQANSLLGVIGLLGLAWLLSSAKRKMNWRLISAGLALQFVMGFLMIHTQQGLWLMEQTRGMIQNIMGASDVGAEMVFGKEFREHFFAFSVMPSIVFFSSLLAVLYHFGVMQRLVQVMAYVMVKLMDVSGAESLAASANVFLGQTEAALVIKPYVERMTRSEVMALMVGGMANVSGGIVPAYISFGADAGFLLASSLMSAPASLVIAKIIEPEIEEPLTKGKLAEQPQLNDVNAFDAACRGASEGLWLALNVVAMMIAFLGLAAVANQLLASLGPYSGMPLSWERILGWLFTPIALLIGVPWSDASAVGGLLGTKLFLNELIAYRELQTIHEQLSPRSVMLATYALCGFANFGSIAVLIGGIGVLVPAQRSQIAKLGVRAMLGGTLATCMTAAVAGVLT